MPEKKQTNRSSDRPPTFEEGLDRLETIVRLLEEGELSLSESLDQYQQALGCLKSCHEQLQQAERKIELLTGQDAQGRPMTEPFDEGDTSLDEKAASRGRRRSRPE